MSIAAAIRLSGLVALVAVNGEPLVYSSNGGGTTKTIMALVDRMPVRPKDGLVSHGEVDFTIAGLSCIEFPFGTITKPSAADTFIDAQGFRHRARFVTATDISWIVYCTPNATT